MAKKAACPVISIWPAGDGNRSFLAMARTKSGTKRVGVLELYDMPPADKRGRPRLAVIAIAVDPTMQRCGVGTKLYAMAAQLACHENRTLVSDESRTKCSDGFWKKQVAKKRAKCAKKWPEAPGTHWADDAPGCGGPAEGRSGCSFYALTKPCPTSLEGPKRRR